MTHRLRASRFRLSDQRVLRVVRRSGRHIIHDLAVDVALDGAGAAPADVARIVRTAAVGEAAAEPEAFARTIARNCDLTFEGAAAVRVEVRSRAWDRLDVGGRPRDRDMIGPAGVVRIARAMLRPGTPERLSAGLRGMRFMTSAAPAGTDARVLLLRLDAIWTYGWAGIPFDTQWQQVRRVLAEAYAERSLEPGAPLAAALAGAVLDESPAVRRIAVRLGVVHPPAMDADANAAPGPAGAEGESGRCTHTVVMERAELAQ